MKDYKNFINYFKRSDSIASTGLGILAAGGLLFLLGWWFFWLFFYIGVPLIPIGLVIYIYGTSSSTDEETLKKIIQENANAITFADLKENLEYRRRMSKNPTEETFGGYVFNDNVLMKKTKSSTMVSSEYVCAKMLILNDALCIRSCAFSFISDDKHKSEIEIPFSLIEKLRLKETAKPIRLAKKSSW